MLECAKGEDSVGAKEWLGLECAAHDSECARVMRGVGAGEETGWAKKKRKE